MNIKNLTVQVSQDDIKNFLSLQNKVKIKDIMIDNNINIVGEIQCLSNWIGFKSILSISKVENNKVYIEVKNFNIFNFNIINKIFKKAFNYFIQAFTDIKGISFEEEFFKLDADKIIEKYYMEKNIINLNGFEITNIKIKNGNIELILEGIGINTDVIKGEKEEIYLNAEVIEEAELELALTVEDIETYKNNFSENNFFNKIREYSKNAGISVVYATLILYYTYKDETVPLSAKAISLGALGYFIIPTDLIPDIIVLTGYSDDFVALITGIKSITSYINDDIKLNAKKRLDEWFNSIDEKELEKVDLYL